ncbi:MAG: MotA/TolQ/ExbB proton channel family protein, partial [SAR324 cluster bacterium]|nr:MotA/TolQ/ExbB proton channel family protein [SAR324 cluster bacterium]
SRCLQVLGNTALLMGIFGTLIGVILILQTLDDLSALAPASAIASITLFYGTLFKLLAYVADQRVRNLYLGVSEPSEE